jgi:hypothetical protein
LQDPPWCHMLQSIPLWLQQAEAVNLATSTADNCVPSCSLPRALGKRLHQSTRIFCLASISARSGRYHCMCWFICLWTPIIQVHTPLIWRSLLFAVVRSLNMSVLHLRGDSEDHSSFLLRQWSW